MINIICPSCGTEARIGFAHITSLDWKNDPDDQLSLKCCGCVPLMPQIYRVVSTIVSFLIGALTFNFWETSLDQDAFIKALVFFVVMLLAKFTIAIVYLKLGGSLESAN